MKLMYELAIKLIDIYILISSLFNKKLKRIYEGRKDTFKYIELLECGITRTLLFASGSKNKIYTNENK